MYITVINVENKRFLYVLISDKEKGSRFFSRQIRLFKCES